MLAGGLQPAPADDLLGLVNPAIAWVVYGRFSCFSLAIAFLAPYRSSETRPGWLPPA